VHGWFEEWLQTEWPHLRVHVANVTEHWAQIAVAGPQARAILSRLKGDIDFAPGAFKPLDMRAGRLAGVPVRVFRISYSGELSFEIATPAPYVLHLWEALLEAGRPEGLAPYGIEALHVLRAEKGFIAIGDETDGTVIPQDLGLAWAVSSKKADFVGKRGMARAHMIRPDRPQLVGVLTEDPSIVLPDGAPAVERLADRGPTHALGHVTSTYRSPTLKRSIALALIEGGRGRIGQTLGFSTGGKALVRARLVEPAFYDPAGERMNG
jgi:sarcosine oxidase subunit alpha